jgi:peroxiredoxin
MRTVVTLALLSLTVVAGCASTDNGDTKPKKSRLTRFAFKKDLESNRPTGKKLPKQEGVELVDAMGKSVKLSDFRGKPMVLAVMRGFAGFVCPYCTTQTAQLATRYEEIKAAGAEVVIVYPTKSEEPEKIKDFVEACNEILEEEGEDALPFPVLLDPGVKLVTKYNLEGIDLSRPSLFVLDAEGLVRYAYVGKKVSDRPSPDRILEELSALTKD